MSETYDTFNSLLMLVSIRPIWPIPTRCTLPINRHVNIAAEEEGQSPVKVICGSSYRSTQIRKDKIVAVEQRIGIGHAEIHGTAGAVRPLIHGSEIIGAGWTIEAVAGTAAIGNATCRAVQKEI